MARRRKQTTPRAGTTGYFLSLTVSGFRCFGPTQTLDLSDGRGNPAQWTIILGANGTGKSSLLQAIAGLEITESGLMDDVPRLFSLGPGNDLTKSVHPSGSQAVISAVTVSRAGLGENGRTDNGVGFGPEEHSLRFAPDGVDPAGLHVGNVPICYGYGPSRRAEITSLAGTAEDDAALSLYFEDVDLRNAEEWLLRADYAASKVSEVKEQSERYLQRVKSLLCSILPDVSEVRIAQPTRGRPFGTTVEFVTPYGGVPFHNLSQGYRSMVVWMIDLASRLAERYPDSADPLAEPAVVLVDEVDLHLHPGWQRRLVDHLTGVFRNTQFVVTAHSPLIVQGAGDANIAVLRREGDHAVIDNDAEAVRGWRVDQILTSDLFDLPTARPPEFDALLAKRTKLLGQPVLTDADKAELATVEAAIGRLPTEPDDADARRMLKLAEETDAILKRYGG